MRTPSKLFSTALVTLGVICQGLLLSSSPAAAFTAYEFTPPPFGAFSHPTGVAVERSTGDVYVVNGGGPEVIEVFSATGGSPAGGGPAQLTGATTPAGAFNFRSEPAGVAIDNSGGASDGDIYITDVANQVIDKFKLNGAHEYEYLSQLTGFGEPLGVTVDGHGNVFVADYSNSQVHEYNSEGAELAQYSSPHVSHPQSVAVGADNTLYIEDYSEHNLVALARNPAGEMLAETVVATEGVEAIATDLTTGYLLVDFGTHVAEYSGGVLLGQFGSGVLGNSLGLAVNESSGKLYASDSEGGVIDPFGAIVRPDATTDAATGVQGTAATLHGTVKPNGIAVTNVKFEYGTSEAYEFTSAAVPAEVAAGEAEAAISASLTGLEPNRTYHYRIVSESANGESTGADRTFVTSLKPDVNDQPPSSSDVTHRGVVLAGTVNPENSETTYVFEYGTSEGYGSSTPREGLGSGSTDAQVAPQAISELQPATLYHYRLVATNSAGTEAGPDHTFTTTPAQLPEVSTGAASSVSYNNAVVTGSVNPDGLPTSYVLELGTDKNYGAQLFGSVDVAGGTQTTTLALSGLAAGTTYHYRLVATNEDGTVTGADQSFTTPSYPIALSQPPTPVLVALAPAPVVKVTVKPKKPTKKKSKSKKKPKKKKAKAKKK